VKKNLPVTQQEKPFIKGKYIVSKTDLKGSITYANDAFIEMSGFTYEELIGKNHNIVRHPDVPPQAFADLWENLKEGRPWRGIVKNRSKNGDHYWVDALVVPVRKNNQTIGYMSVRTEATRSQIAAAEPLYRALNASGKSIPRPSPWSRVTLRTKMFGLALGLILLQVMSAASGFFDGELTLPAAVHPVLAFLSVVIGMSLIVMQNGVFRALGAATQDLDCIAQGNLAERIENSRLDEVGKIYDALITMQSHLKVMLAEISEVTEVVGRNSGRLEDKMAAVGRQSASQSGAANEIAAAISEMTASIENVASDARDSADSTETSRSLLAQATRQMEQSREASQLVVATVSQASTTMLDLFKSIYQIGTITQAIQEIAGQTNLIALNAAIEAARAGEQGRGFAVVADEVRKLAERTRLQTDEITKTVQVIQQATQITVTTMEEAGGQVGKADAQILGAKESLNAVVQQGNKIYDMTQHMATATTEESSAIQEIARQINSIAGVIEENLGHLVEAGESTTQLKETAEQLGRLVAYFRILPGQGAARANGG
jgi:aerotaxis receptor